MVIYIKLMIGTFRLQPFYDSQSDYRLSDYKLSDLQYYRHINGKYKGLWTNEIRGNCNLYD